MQPPNIARMLICDRVVNLIKQRHVLLTCRWETLERKGGVSIINCGEDFKIELANELAAIAERFGIRMFSCCGDYLIGQKIQKAHCIDGGVIESLFFPEGLSYKEKPTRKECGCTESTDIGTYDTCPHGCVYCYANANKHKAGAAFRDHDKQRAFLGYSKSQSDKWLAEIQSHGPERNPDQLKMF